MKIKKILIYCLIVVLSISTGITSSYAQGYTDYNATKCRNYFTTSGFQTKFDDESWHYFSVCANITYSPALPSGARVYQKTCIIGNSSVVLGPKEDVDTTPSNAGFPLMVDLCVYDSDVADNYNVLRCRIFNPYGSSYNMKTYGSFLFV